MFMHAFINMGLKTIIYAIRHFDYQKAGLTILTWYSETVERCKYGIRTVYNIPFVKGLFDECVYCLQYAKCSIIGQRIQPMNSGWICMTILKEHATLDKNNLEIYEYLDENKLVEEEFLNNCDSIKSTVQYNAKFNNSLITMKVEDKYYCRHYDSAKLNHEPETFQLQVCKPVLLGKFLNIEYTHPDMSQGIVIQLDKGYWVEGNHILSNVFIKRWLEYQMLPYKFDERYCVTILDGDVNVVLLRWGQGIVLGEGGGYEII